MQKLILAHVPGDEGVAQQLCAAVGGVSVLVRHATSSVQVGAGAVLGVVWSAKAVASPAGVRLGELAAEAPSAILFRTDETPASEALAAQRLITVTPGASEEDFLAAVRLAQRVQPRRAATRARRDVATPDFAPRVVAAEPKSAYGRMFVSGMTLGFASSVAILSLGAGAAVGVQEKAGVLGVADSFAHSFEPASAHVAEVGATQDLEQLHGMAGLISDGELARQASALRQAAATQRAQIFQQLSGAEQQLADARARTDGVIARLNALSAQASTFAAAAPQTVRAAQPATIQTEAVQADAPAAPQLAEAPVESPAADAAPVIVDASILPAQQAALPADDIYALTRYADGLADAASKPVEPSNLGLWSPI